MPASLAYREVHRRIEAARELLQPSEVRLHKVPGWLRRRIMATINVGRDNTSGHDALTVGLRAARADEGIDGLWLDHWGTTPWGEYTAFVAEPYLALRSLKNALRFAEFFSLYLILSPNSWWYPGETTRLVFLPKEPRR